MFTPGGRSRTARRTTHRALPAPKAGQSLGLPSTQPPTHDDSVDALTPALGRPNLAHASHTVLRTGRPKPYAAYMGLQNKAQRGPQGEAVRLGLRTNRTRC
eukprot:6201053-Pleurochrysis_carterae.AAC.3